MTEMELSFRWSYSPPPQLAFVLVSVGSPLHPVKFTHVNKPVDISYLLQFSIFSLSFLGDH